MGIMRFVSALLAAVCAAGGIYAAMAFRGAPPVLLDPPRKGVEQPVIDAVLRTRPRRVVYVSCHVPTQARDVKLLREGGYRLEACQPVDMFCYAGGVENVISMTLDETQD